MKIFLLISLLISGVASADVTVNIDGKTLFCGESPSSGAQCACLDGQVYNSGNDYGFDIYRKGNLVRTKYMIWGLPAKNDISAAAKKCQEETNKIPECFEN